MKPNELDNEGIDRQFAAIAGDDEYQVFQTELAESFGESDWDALVQVERGLKFTLDL